jgi:hypothetical protein
MRNNKSGGMSNIMMFTPCFKKICQLISKLQRGSQIGINAHVHAVSMRPNAAGANTSAFY